MISVRSLRSPFRATKSFPASQNIASLFAHKVFSGKNVRRTGLLFFFRLPRFVFVLFSTLVWEFVGYSTVICSPIVGLVLFTKNHWGKSCIFSLHTATLHGVKWYGTGVVSYGMVGMVWCGLERQGVSCTQLNATSSSIPDSSQVP